MDYVKTPLLKPCKAHIAQHLSGNLTECFTGTKQLNTSQIRKSGHTVLPLLKPTCECALGKYYIHYYEKLSNFLSQRQRGDLTIKYKN